MEPLLAVDVQGVAADAVDGAAHGDQQAAQLLHVRFAGGIAEDGGALGEGGGHQGVLGGCYGGLVEEDIGAAQSAGGGQLEAAAVGTGEGGAQLFEDEQVGVDAAAADVVAAGCALDAECAAAGEERPHQVQAAADASEELGVGRVTVQFVGAQGEAVAFFAHIDAEAFQNGEHGGNVVYLRDVFQGDGLVGEQRGGDKGEGGVFVAADVYSSLDAVAALDGK